jgi:hypothetical protein
MSDYTVPRYAASAWIAGDQLWLAFPALGPGDRGHSVPFKIDMALLRALTQGGETSYLGDRAKDMRGLCLAIESLAARSADSAIGTRGSPAKHDMRRAMESSEKFKEWLSAMGAEKAVSKAEKEEAEAFLRECGL